MDEYWGVRGKKVLCLAEATTSVKELLTLIGNEYVSIPFLLVDILNNQMRKVVGVDDYALCSGVYQFLRHMLEKGYTTYRHKSFGHLIGKWLKACS